MAFAPSGALEGSPPQAGSCPVPEIRVAGPGPGAWMGGASDWHAFLHRGPLSRRKGGLEGGASLEGSDPRWGIRVGRGSWSQFPPSASVAARHGDKKRANRRRAMAGSPLGSPRESLGQGTSRPRCGQSPGREPWGPACHALQPRQGRKNDARCRGARPDSAQSYAPVGACVRSAGPLPGLTPWATICRPCGAGRLAATLVGPAGQRLIVTPFAPESLTFPAHPSILGDAG